MNDLEKSSQQEVDGAVSSSTASQSGPAFFTLQTASGQHVVQDGSSNHLEMSGDGERAVIFQWTNASDGLVKLETMGGHSHISVDPDLGVVVENGSASPTALRKVPMGDGFALCAPDKQSWLSTSPEGKLVFLSMTTPGAAETFHPQALSHIPRHGCDGPSLPSAALWDDIGHKTIVLMAILGLENPISETRESKEFTRLWGATPNLRTELMKGLLEADYLDALNDRSTPGGIPWYTSHFYDPDTKKNYCGDSEPNALHRGSVYFRDSLGALTEMTHYEMLGVALHYLTDLTQPMHAAGIANVYGDHFPWPLLGDWRHTKFENYAEDVAKSGKLFENYPRFTAEQMDISGIKEVEELYEQTARQSKAVWMKYVKPIYEKKGYGEAWGDEAHEALRQSTYNAPVVVARMLLYWTHLRMASA